MKTLIKYILTVCVLFTWTGCSEKGVRIDNPVPDGEITLKMKVNTPDPAGTPTRAVNETGLNEVTVLVLEDTGSGNYVYRYTVVGYSIAPSNEPDADYEFLARIVPSDNNLRLYIIANGGSSVNGVSAGMTEAEIRTSVTLPYTSAGFTDYLPMTGTVDVPGGLTGNITRQTTLVRSIARVDVVNNATSDFTLTSVKIYRANDRIQLFPNSITGNSVTAPSVPATATADVNSPTYPVTGATLTQQIYIPESAMPAPGDRNLTATCVVVGGRFGNDTQNTYYRMDFLPEGTELFGQVLRNRIYRFEIEDVLAPGWPTDDDASVNPSTQIEGEIKEWDSSTVYMVFDDYDYLGVTARTVALPYYSGSTRTIGIDTSLDTYTVWWADADGNIITGGGSVIPGGNFIDPDQIFRVAVSGDGTEVTVTALESYDTSSDLPKYLLFEAGRMRVLITITQQPLNFTGGSVGIANSTGTAGSLGDYRAGITSPLIAGGDRTYGLLNILLHDTNFGPAAPAKVLMDGFVVSGYNTDGSRMPRSLYLASDVLYLTYDKNPIQSDVDEILEWLGNNEHRVLIVQFDNQGTNNLMMNTLGFPVASRVYGNEIRSFSYDYANSPGFIRSGPFGTLSASFDYNCRDNTYGTIVPTTADGLGYIPILLSNSPSTTGYYVMAINPQRRIIICGDCDVYSNANAGSGGNYLNYTITNYTVAEDQPAGVMMSNLWAWIAETVLSE